MICDPVHNGIKFYICASIFRMHNYCYGWRDGQKRRVGDCMECFEIRFFFIVSTLDIRECVYGRIFFIIAFSVLSYDLGRNAPAKMDFRLNK